MSFEILQALSLTPPDAQWFGLAPAFFAIAAVGFFAQLVDGALGMAYGITSSSLMLGLGIPPQAVSASVHAAEVFTTGASGISHGLVGNIDFKLMWRLALPGVAGGIVGALLLSQLDVSWLKLLVALYLLCIGLLVLRRAWLWRVREVQANGTRSLGLIAGFLDAIGGGGWGTITTGSLIAKNHAPHIAIGSANAAEFFVTAAIASVLLQSQGLVHLQVIAALVLGGVLAAPIAAILSKRIPARAALVAVGALVVSLSLFNIGTTL